MGSGILPETTVGKHNLQMPTKALSCRNKAICGHDPEASSCPVGQSSFKMDRFKVDKGSDEFGRRILRAKEEGDLPACYQPEMLGCLCPYRMHPNNIIDA